MSIISVKASAYHDLRARTLTGFIGTVNLSGNVGWNNEGLSLNGVNQSVGYGAVSGTLKTLSLLLKIKRDTDVLCDLDGGTHTVEVTSNILSAPGWISPSFYVNNVASNTLTQGEFNLVTITTDTGFNPSDFTFGVSPDFPFIDLQAVFISGDALTASEVSQLYGELIDQNFITSFEIRAQDDQYNHELFSTEFGVEDISVPAGGSQGTRISNSNIFTRDSSYAGRIFTERNFNSLTKVLEQTSVGAAILNENTFGQTPTELAFGEWQFYFNKPDALVFQLFAVSDGDDFGSTNGYRLDFLSDESFALQEVSGGIASSLFATLPGAFTADMKNKLTMRRKNNGEITILINDIPLTANTGSNPTIDLTHTISNFLLWASDGPGIKIDYASTNGQNSIIKKLVI